MKSVSFVVSAKRYFSQDADRLREAKDDEACLVYIDFEEKKADFTWYQEDENPANFPAEEDDFEAVCEEFAEEIREKLEENRKTNIRQFFQLEGIREVERDGFTIHYTNEPNFQTYAVVEDMDGHAELVDVSERDWEDFDDFLAAVMEEYQGK